MGSTKEDQTARRRATQDVIAANRPLFEERMRHYYAEMGLGEWTPRLSAEERAEAKAVAKKQAAAAKIAALAASAGIGVLLVDDPEIQEKIKATHDGTAETIPYARDVLADDAEDEAAQRRQDEEEDAANEVEAAS